MLISKKSPRTSARFASRFGDRSIGDFPLRQYLRLREDLVTESNQRELNQRSAPAVEDGLFLVPKVIE